MEINARMKMLCVDFSTCFDPGASNFPKIQKSLAYQKPGNENIFCRIFSKLVARIRKMVNIVGSLRERVSSFVFLCSPRALRAKQLKFYCLENTNETMEPLACFVYVQKLLKKCIK